MMPPTPKAVRVKTSNGWQDIAIVGPKGPPSGQMVLIEDKILTTDAALLDFQNIPQTFAALRLIVYARSSNVGAFDTTYLRFNGDTSSIYDHVRVAATGGGFQAGSAANLGGIGIGHTQGAGGPANAWTTFDIMIPNYANTFGHKNAICHSQMKQGAATTDFFVQTFAGWWRSIAAINRVNLFMTNNFVVGSRATLYGIKAESENYYSGTEYAYRVAPGASSSISVPANTWKTIPLPAAADYSIPSGAFIRNADGSLTVRDPGIYTVHAVVGMDTPSSITGATALIADTLDSATPIIREGVYIGSPSIPRILVAGDVRTTIPNVKMYVNAAAGVALTNVVIDTFAIHRVGAGPPGPGGGQITGQTYAITAGYTKDRALNPEATSLTEVARLLGTLIDDMKASGLIAS